MCENFGGVGADSLSGVGGDFVGDFGGENLRDFGSDFGGANFCDNAVCNAESKPVIAISIGDINGIGPILATLCHSEASAFCLPLYITHRKVLEAAAAALGMSADIVDSMEVVEPDIAPPKVRFGVTSKASGAYSYQSFKLAVELARDAINLRNSKNLGADYTWENIDYKSRPARKLSLFYNIKGVVTLPINKHAWNLAGINYAGHTQALSAMFSAHLKNALYDRAIMVLGCEAMSVALFTEHVALKDVAKHIKKAKLQNFLRALHACWGLDSTERVCVLGLNPHCGDGGVMGTEERIINRAICAANAVIASGAESPTSRHCETPRSGVVAINSTTEGDTLESQTDSISGLSSGSPCFARSRNDDSKVIDKNRVESSSAVIASGEAARQSLFIDSRNAPMPSLRGASAASNEAISLSLDDSSKEIASPFASQKTRNDDSKSIHATSVESSSAVIASHAQRGVAINSTTEGDTLESQTDSISGLPRVRVADARNDDSRAIHTSCVESSHAKPTIIAPFTLATPADSAFTPPNRARFRHFVAMSHDVGLAPLKALYFEQSINITLNLPILRASPDHGVAYDIVKNLPDAKHKISKQSYLNSLYYIKNRPENWAL